MDENNEKYAEIIKSLNDVKTQQNKIITCINNQNDKLSNLNKKFDDLLNTVSTLSEENKKLKEKIKTLEDKIEKIEKPATSIGNEQDIISELIDRQLRANNIIIFNLPETTNQDQPQDYDKLKNMFNNIMAVNISDFSCARLGKIIQNDNSKPRPLKVILRNSLEALTVLRSQAKLRSSSDWTNIRCASDRTLKQREHMSSLRNELQRRRNNGEDNIIIKYIKGIPNIICTPKN